jgi:hypothetical protein
VSDSGDALVAAAAAKSDLLWVRPEPSGADDRTGPGGRAWPAWHVWHDGAAYVVSGPGEQELPPLSGDVEVILRSRDTFARLVTVRATASTVDPDDPGWAEAAGALKVKRLNAPDPDHLLDRWARAATITRLSLSGGLLEGPGRYDERSGSAPPPATEATTVHWAPWHLRGRTATRRARRRARRSEPGSERGSKRGG